MDSRVVCCTLQDMRRHQWDQWDQWSAGGGGGGVELDWCPGWLAVGAVTGSGGRVSQLPQAVPSCSQLPPRARGG